jgi:hypothetical protein
MAGNRLLPDSNASEWGRPFSLQNLNQNEEIFRDIFLCPPINGTALMFFMIRPFPRFLVPFMHDLAQAIVVFFVQRSRCIHTLGG